MKISQLREKIISLVEGINEINKLLPIFSLSGIPAEEMRIKIEPIVKEFEKILPGVRIALTETLKNGMSIREVFNLTYGEVEYSKCSTGEKMLINIAVSQIIDNLSGNKINMHFLDNSESISELPAIDNNKMGQLFIAKVTNNNLEIK